MFVMMNISRFMIVNIRNEEGVGGGISITIDLFCPCFVPTVLHTLCGRPAVLQGQPCHFMLIVNHYLSFLRNRSA